MEWRSRDGLVRVKTASAGAARLAWQGGCHGRATYAWAMTGGLVVKHGGAVLAVEGTYMPIGASIGCTDGIVIKRRTGAGDDGLCSCYPLGWIGGEGGMAAPHTRGISWESSW